MKNVKKLKYTFFIRKFNRYLYQSFKFLRRLWKISSNSSTPPRKPVGVYYIYGITSLISLRNALWRNSNETKKTTAMPYPFSEPNHVLLHSFWIVVTENSAFCSKSIIENGQRSDVQTIMRKPISVHTFPYTYLLNVEIITTDAQF